MRQGIQSQLRDAEVNEYGCYALCLIAWAEHDMKQILSNNAIIDIINDARLAGFIGKECFVNEPVKLYNLVYGKPFYSAVKKQNNLPEDNLYPSYVVCNKKPMYTHFTAVLNGTPWDPLPPDRPSARSYTPDSYRILYHDLRGGHE
jgi:hypothetical protein